MSEQQEPTQADPKAKAKKSKLPMIIVLAVVLGGGGFFGMKMRGGKPAKPAPKLGEMADLPKEFLVPLRGGQGSYLRTDIALHFVEGFDTAHGMEKSMPAIRDAIIGVLMSKAREDLERLDDLKKLKEQIAAAVNVQLAHEDHAEKPEEGKGKVEGKGDAHAPEAKPAKKDEKHEDKHADWDSKTGPVLKVYFTSFATQ